MWQIVYSSKAQKQYGNLPKAVRDALDFLTLEIERLGPVRGNWPGYGKLADGSHHCHIKKGRPTYVAVWEEVKDQIRIVRIKYAGTHEKAPY